MTMLITSLTLGYLFATFVTGWAAYTLRLTQRGRVLGMDVRVERPVATIILRSAAATACAGFAYLMLQSVGAL